VSLLQKNSAYQIQSFDLVSAIELASRTAQAIQTAKGKRSGTHPRTDWTKIKFDRQIMSIAITSGASCIISNDTDLQAIGVEWNFPVKGIEDLPLPQSHVPPPLFEALEED
jgi:hypothetical protein